MHANLNGTTNVGGCGIKPEHGPQSTLGVAVHQVPGVTRTSRYGWATTAVEHLQRSANSRVVLAQATLPLAIGIVGPGLIGATLLAQLEQQLKVTARSPSLP